MHFDRLRLRDFRNYPRLDVEFGPGFHLLLGRNAQGKTNLLEALYLLATLRSFRGVGGAQLVRHGASGYFVGATVTGTSTNEIKWYWSSRERKLALNGRPVRRFSEYLGTIRAVVFCTEDLQLIKGPGKVRRRFLDLLLSQTEPTYLETLFRYTQALRSRNVLLKDPNPDSQSLDSFTREVVEAGQQLGSHRSRLVPRFRPLLLEAFERIAGAGEALDLLFQPSVQRDFAVELAQARPRERVHRTTVIGPHRDDIEFRLNGRTLVDFGSEGQKRSVAIALKMAQVKFLAAVHGQSAVLLIDDVMGELDVTRRGAFLPLLHAARGTGGQVFMTCTEENWPRDLQFDSFTRRWNIHSGILTPEQG